MIWITSQPDEIRFIWETIVQEENFKDHGVDLSTVYCLFGVKGEPSVHLKHLKQISKMNIITYPDHIAHREYSPSIQFHLLKQFYRDYRPAYVFHIDSDVIMRELPAFTGMMDGHWHVSEASCYLDYTYLCAFPEFLEGVEELFGITKEWLLEHQRRGSGVGGPNYLMCGIDETFWEEVEEMSTVLFHRFAEKPPEDKEGKKIQIWTAGMWAWTWCAWRRNLTLKVDEELRFVMSDHMVADYDANFFHNTGGDCERLPLFNKGIYTQGYPFESEKRTGSLFAQAHYLSYINRIIQHQQTDVSFVKRNTNTLYDAKTWWIIEGEEEPTLEDQEHLLSIKNYREPVYWKDYCIRRKLYGSDNSHQ